MTPAEIAELLQVELPILVTFLLAEVMPYGEWEPASPRSPQRAEVSALVYLDLLYDAGGVYRPTLMGQQVIACLNTPEGA